MTQKLGRTEMHLLREGIDDWVPLLTVARLVEGSPRPRREQDEAVLGVVRNLLAGSLVEVGVLSSGQFHPWHVGTDAAIERLRLLLRASDEERDWGFVAWLRNTEAGSSLGREVPDSEIEDWVEDP